MAVWAAAGAVFIFWEPLFVWPAGTLLDGDDYGYMFIPWLNFIFDSLRQHGVLPLWNPYLFSGAPFYANPQPMLFYPFTYLGLLMSVTRAMAVTLVIHVCLMGLGMYGWLRSLGATHAGAFLAGAAFAFTGAFAVRVGAGHYATALQLAWWPLSAWALRITFARLSWRWAVLSGAPLALALLSGHSVTALLLYLLLGLHTGLEAGMAYQQSRRGRIVARVLLLAALAVATSAALAAVQYLPFFNLSRLAQRAAEPSLDFASRFSTPIGHLITLLIPDFFGEPIRNGYWSVEGYAEITYYVGVLIVLIAAAGAQLLRQRRVLFFLGLMLGAIVFQWGTDSALYMLFYRFVPGVALTRAPGRGGLMYAFAAITAAGLVWSELERAWLDQKRLQHLLGIFSPTLIWLVSTLGIGATILAFVLYAANPTEATVRLWHLGGQITRFLVLFWAAMALLTAWRERRLSQRAVNTLAITLLMFDLWSYGLKNVRPETARDAVWPLSAGFMQDKPGYRISMEDGQFYEHNGALAHRLRSIYGYDPIVPARYQALLDSAPSYADRVYDILNVRYLVTREPLDLGPSAPIRVSAEIDGVRFYRRPNALPRAFIVHAAQVVADDAAARAALHAPEFVISQTVTLPAAPPCPLEAPPAAVEETAQVVGESPNRLELTTRSASAGLLVLSETYYPGWQATVDGQPATVLRADTVLRAICLPAGAHTVRFDFAPRDLIVGAVASCLALAVVLAAAVWPRAK
jgi:hypothetical protein